MDLVSFQQIFMKKVRVQSHQHIQRQIRKEKIESKNTPKKSPAPQNTTESSFLLVSDPLEDLNFRFFGLSFFQQIFMKKVKSPELPAYSAADSQEKDRVQKHPQKVHSYKPTSQKPVFSTF